MNKFVAWLIDIAKWFAVCLILMGILFAMIIFLPPARAEGNTVTVVAVFYNEDTFIVEDSSGNRDLYDDRGDLIPGDVLIITGDQIQLVEQSNWVWFDLCVDGDPAASFLYAEDAESIKEALFGELSSFIFLCCW